MDNRTDRQAMGTKEQARTRKHTKKWETMKSGHKPRGMGSKKTRMCSWKIGRNITKC